ncbi:MAG TPA: ATP-binding protein, partial [Alphaproteobacteria bacterium]|nr:ATP-binding protein [Alphaproteobacteria bacterium]
MRLRLNLRLLLPIFVFAVMISALLGYGFFNNLRLFQGRMAAQADAYANDIRSALLERVDRAGAMADLVRQMPDMQDWLALDNQGAIVTAIGPFVEFTDLDLLTVYHPNGIPAAKAHDPSSFGRPDELGIWLMTLPRDLRGRPALSVQAMDNRLALLSARPIDGLNGLSGYVVAGYWLESDFVAALKRRSPVDVTLEHQGRTVVTSLGARTATAAAIARPLALAELGLGRDFAVTVYYDIGDATDVFWRQLLWAALTLALLAATVVALSLASTRRSVIRPLQAMTATMTRIAAGDRAVPVPGADRRDEIGDMAAAVLVFRDNMARVAELQDRLQGIMDTVGEGIVTLDRQGYIRSFNAAAETLTGHPAAAVIGRPCAVLLPEAARGQGPFGSLITLVGRHETDIRRADGTVFPADLNVTELRRGDETLFIGTLRDITERRRAQARLEQEVASRTVELRAAAADARQAREAAEAASRAKSSFLATMSHEIRTPMNGVLGLLELLQETRLDTEQAEMVAVVRDSASSLLKIIDDILDFSKIEAGKLQIERTAAAPLELVEGVAEALASSAHKRKLSLMTFVDPSVPAMVLCDPVRVRQILFNLIGNAVKFTEHGGITVRCAWGEGQALRFTVTDTGIGLGPDAQARLFRPFVQADSTTTRRFGGTGLGLSICKRLVELMGGEIGVDSAPGRGATFWFSLPIEPAQAPAAPEPGFDLSGLAVLVVDDDPAARHIL